MQTDCNNNEVVFAGFWVRLGAFIIDQMIVGAALLIVRLVLAIVSLLGGGAGLNEQLLFSYSSKNILLYLCGVSYFIVCTYYTGTTPGKRLMNLRVIDGSGLAQLPAVNVIYRETVGRFLSGFLVAIGYLLIAIDNEKRGLHDILCDTRVIYAKKITVYPKYVNTGYQNPGSFQQKPPEHIVQEDVVREDITQEDIAQGDIIRE